MNSRYVRIWLHGMVVFRILPVEENDEDCAQLPSLDYPLQPFITENVSSCFKKDGPLSNIFTYKSG